MGHIVKNLDYHTTNLGKPSVPNTTHNIHPSLPQKLCFKTLVLTQTNPQKPIGTKHDPCRAAIPLKFILWEAETKKPLRCG
jgi:hypothetical protein